MKTTIIIPHKHTPANDECLELNLKMLKENTTIEYDLMIDDTCPKDPYQIWNELSMAATTDTLVFTNTDVLLAPGWDKMVEVCQPNTIVTGYLVECGAIGVASENIHKNFGSLPNQFDRGAFEKYCAQESRHKPPVKVERGWYMPCAVNREWFCATEKFRTDKGGFPLPLDIWFWLECEKDPNFKLLRANSWAYHFQNLSCRI